MAIGTIYTNKIGNIRNVGAQIQKPLIILNNRDITFSPNNNSGTNYVASVFDLYYNAGISGGGYASRFFTQTGTIDFKKYKRLQAVGTYANLSPGNGSYGYIHILKADGTVYREIWNVGQGNINIDLDISTWTFEGKIRFQNYNWCDSSGGSTGRGRFTFSKFECNFS